MKFTRAFAMLLAGVVPLLAGQSTGTQLPEAPNREVVQRICSSCHPAQIVLGRGMTREQWGAIVSNMISRGAKGTDEEFAQVVNYLADNLPATPTSKSAAPAAKAAPRRPQNLIDQAGANDKQVVDEEAAARGKIIYVSQCASCHGSQARGGKGPDLVRSLVVLHDRYGSVIGPYTAEGHPNAEAAKMTADQIGDLSHFLHQQVGNTLRTGPFNSPLNILVGDAREGKAFFNGPGKCSQCHSVTGDLAHIGSKYDPPVLQLKVVFPQTAAFGKKSTPNARKPVTVTVTTANGESVSGVLNEIDDFNVSLRDDAGQYHSFERSAAVKVEKHDPYAAHVALLDEYTDKDIHDVVAYLETLK